MQQPLADVRADKTCAAGNEEVHAREATKGSGPLWRARTFHFALWRSRFILTAMPDQTLLQIELPGVRKLKSGKVREIFDLGDSLLFVATDRISAFDCIMPNPIPRKGEVLTQISYFRS